MSGKVWFITGCSTGFGKELAKIVSENKDCVVGTVRQEHQITMLEQLGQNITGVLMDVTKLDTIKKAIAKTLSMHGKIDVLVNNAGYGSLGSIEEVPEAEMMRQFDVNVYGPVRIIKEVLPHMRKQQSGHIINITSIAGLQGYPGVGIYNGSKFALEGIGEALAAEVNPLGIKVTNVEPGPFRTDWAGRSATYTEVSIDDYTDTAEKNSKAISYNSGRQIGDPVRAMEAIYELTKLEVPPVHLPLGEPAYTRAKSKFNNILEEIEKYEYLGLPTDYTEEELKQLESDN